MSVFCVLGSAGSRTLAPWSVGTILSGSSSFHLLPHSWAWLVSLSGDSSGLAQPSLAWLPRLPFVPWS